MAKSQPSTQHLLQVGKSDERCNIIFDSFMKGCYVSFADVKTEPKQLIPEGIVSMTFCFYWNRTGRGTITRHWIRAQLSNQRIIGKIVHLDTVPFHQLVNSFINGISE